MQFHRDHRQPQALCCVAILAAIALTSGCSAPRTASEPPMPLPSYASRLSAQGWAVTCASNATVYGDWNNVESFYAEDGTQKTLKEFCAGIQAGTRSR